MKHRTIEELEALVDGATDVVRVDLTGGSADEIAGNARLMAAAPDLARQLIEVMKERDNKAAKIVELTDQLYEAHLELSCRGEE